MAQNAMGRLFQWQRTSRLATFSQVRHASSAIPVFSPTASTELNEALNHWRQDLFIPFGLPKRQRTSMFKEKHAHRLQDEPITVKIRENEEYTLRPLDFASLPKSKEIIDVLRLMEAANDYQNLVPFMSGLWNSQMRVSPARWQYLIRKVASTGRLSLIVECARQGQRTGLSLENQDITTRLFYELHSMAQSAEFKGHQVTEALKSAKNALEVMDSYPAIPTTNPKYQPYVIGTLLELSAARATDKFEGKDQGNEVLNYAKKLLARWNGEDFKAVPKNAFDAEVVDQRLIKAIPIFKGLELCGSIDSIAADKELRIVVSQRLNELRGALAKQLERIPKESLEKVPHAKAAKALIARS
ncbi:hypothetical protein N7478_007646 [Penicillium angulare]|uniref:uncharacterized protein n=1 Tax=Penicillium angulare TaxID=116970 RepID=UPI00254103E2|nr:uncharacterized protein N7478_007646 [Penicillium angulare]KAJ5272521.1 hypothetical protein N7478_007646 [Penicillium angulare]